MAFEMSLIKGPHVYNKYTETPPSPDLPISSSLLPVDTLAARVTFQTTMMVPNENFTVEVIVDFLKTFFFVPLRP
jgi:hypothetical protein